MMKKYWGIGVIAILGVNFFTYANAQDFNGIPSYSQTFKENVQLAVTEHPRTSAALATREEQKFREDEARSALYPQIGVDLSGRHRLLNNFEDRFDNITQRSLRDTAANVSLIGRQLIYDGGSTYSRISSAKHAFTAAHEEYAIEASAVALAAVDAHYQILFNRIRKEYHAENVMRHREILDMVNQRFESGRGANQDVTDSDNIIYIRGAEDDAVTSLGQGWVQEADFNIYNVYTAGDATLYVDQDIIQTIS